MTSIALVRLLCKINLNIFIIIIISVKECCTVGDFHPAVLVDPLGNSAAGARRNSEAWRREDAWRESCGAVPSRARRETAQWHSMCQSRFSFDFRIMRMDTSLRLSVLDRTSPLTLQNYADVSATISDTFTLVCIVRGRGSVSELTSWRNTWC